MPMRIRKLVGTVALLLLIALWVIATMALAQLVPMTHGWVAALYYVAAGFGWVMPAMPLIRWMSRPDR